MVAGIASFEAENHYSLVCLSLSIINRLSNKLWLNSIVVEWVSSWHLYPVVMLTYESVFIA